MRTDPSRHAGGQRTIDTCIVTFDAAVASSESSQEIQDKMRKRYGGLELDIILKLGADAAFARR